MTKYSIRMLLTALIIGISTANAGDMKPDVMEHKMVPASNQMEMMQEEPMKEEMKESSMKDEMMDKPPMESDKAMKQKPMTK